MKLKLDLHPIYSEGRQIEAMLQGIIDEACEKRAAEVEIIPGKGSGVLKKSVLRFLDRPEIKAKYHRIEKDSDNWGRLFVHFRWDRNSSKPVTSTPQETIAVLCFCCQSPMQIPLDRDLLTDERRLTIAAECAGCGSPNRVSIALDRRNRPTTSSEPGYEY